MSTGGGWRRPAGWSGAVAMVVVVFVVIGVVAGELAPSPQGPALSSYATTPDGVAAWAELLARDGHAVSQLRAPLAGASLRAGETLVVLGAQGLDRADLRAAQRFIRAGGWAVVGGGELGAELPGLLGRAVSRSPASTWALGAGRIEVLADPAPLENRHLAEGLNAWRALRLTGPPGRPVLFAEWIHGFTQATGLAAIPPRWWVTLAGLALAGLAWALARGRRLGGADPVDPPSGAPRSDYVDALALIISRTRGVDALAGRADAAGARERDFERIHRT